MFDSRRSAIDYGAYAEVVALQKADAPPGSARVVREAPDDESKHTWSFSVEAEVS